MHSVISMNDSMKVRMNERMNAVCMSYYLNGNKHIKEDSDPVWSELRGRILSKARPDPQHCMLHVQSACPCCMSTVCVHAAFRAAFHATCQYWMSVMDIHAACPCCMSMLHGHPSWTSSIYMRHGLAAWKCSMDIHHVHAACPCCKSMLHVHACP
jgi:hypothetical protein